MITSNVHANNPLLRGVSILVADDSYLNIRVAGKFLQQWGVQMDYALSGKEAVEKVRDHAYALVFMDLQMPGMSGLEACSAIRRLPGKAHVPIVALTADNAWETQAEALAAGMNACLVKPFEPDELFNMISMYM
ncbi:response regulator [Deminuibacter soli]|uniref:Response regulator n=1 Tax=Deminuibacter soli TaxID=2291815 RepID=A0A3E1NEH0_9BACT|nr:response regulator [Deminuibacter soli]RFM26379.1 response regulator [Deminuibacter soli]